jgi:hypothetical protein
MWGDSLGVDWAQLVGQDPAMLVVAALGLAGLVLAGRNPVAGVFLGSMASGWATELLNGQPNAFRYLSPSLPPLLLLGALAVAWPVHLLPRVLGLTARAWPGSGLIQPVRRPAPGTVHVLPDGRMRIVRAAPAGTPPTRWGPVAAAAAAWVAVTAAITGAVVVHPAAPLEGAAREYLAAESFPHVWPFSALDGTLVCAGSDYQMWFVTQDGVRYALSGTAMASSLWTPRVLTLAPVRYTHGWPELRPLLTEGMRLCGAGRVFQGKPSLATAPQQPRP